MMTWVILQGTDATGLPKPVVQRVDVPPGLDFILYRLKNPGVVDGFFRSFEEAREEACVYFRTWRGSPE